ncbi:MAG: ribosomal RNA small subunit methyltransferase I [Comamonadaceae bacterium]|nr:ribosomal RNA small subunit methyltransferase I [Comamonadaceae bacterium]
MPNALDLGGRDGRHSQDVLPLRRDPARRRADALGGRGRAQRARAAQARRRASSPLARPLQAIDITELPRPRKGSREPVPAAAWQALLRAGAGRPRPGPGLRGRPAGGRRPRRRRWWPRRTRAGVPVLPLAGPSSLLLALAASGLEGQSFAFVGYLPQEAAARTARIRELEALSRRLGQTQIVIETPYRNAALLAALAGRRWRRRRGCRWPAG